MAFIKVIPRHSQASPFGTLIRYILRGIDDETSIFTHNLHSKDPVEIEQEFIENAQFKPYRKNSISAYHEVISFHEKDSPYLTPEVLTAIAKEYVALRSNNNGLHFAGYHMEKSSGNYHIHMLTSSNFLYSKKANSISKEQLLHIRTELQTFHELQFNIKNSLCDHGASKRLEKTPQTFINLRQAMKEEIKQKINICLEQATSQQHLIELLEKQNLQCYTRNDQLTGVIDNDLKYRFSRLEVDSARIQALPPEPSEQEKILEEFQKIREEQIIPKDRSENRIIQFEENGQIKTVSYSEFEKETTIEGKDGFLETTISSITIEEKDQMDYMYDMINYPESESDNPDYTAEDYNLDCFTTSENDQSTFKENDYEIER